MPAEFSGVPDAVVGEDVDDVFVSSDDEPELWKIVTPAIDGRRVFISVGFVLSENGSVENSFGVAESDERLDDIDV